MSTKSKKEDDSYKRYVLKKNLDILKNKKGFHTGLISLLIPPSRKVHDVMSYLKNEVSESSNIKSKGNRKNVMDSISALMGRLRLIKSFPPNGLAMYSGQIPEDGKPGTEQSELYMIEPTEPLTTFKYYCSSEFLIDPLLDMIREKGTYGIVNIENKEAAVGYISGSKLVISKTFTSGVHSKHKAGGQSQRRLERLIEEGAQAFYKHVSEFVNSVFVDIEDLEGIYVSGAGMSKEKFVNKGDLDYRLKDKVLGFVDVSYSGEAGIRETVIKIQDKLQDLQYIKEKKIFNQFMKEIVKDTGKVTYGEVEVRKALIAGAIDVLLMSEKLNKTRLTVSCTQCGQENLVTIDPSEVDSFYEQIRTSQCPSCQSNQNSVSSEVDLIEDLGAIAEEQGTKIMMMSTDTEEGTTLFQTFGGIAALLRFVM
ncbi:peptide chain release factor aRF-1 [Candidatus Lokiarchaeum ossiferum]|uniref:peptide chain release factor aRF-1 n=1 Tax=Candidatus Lokiarchaeum ossiferum TaxID=2951803 RepID=UPI00352EC5CE